MSRFYFIIFCAIFKHAIQFVGFFLITVPILFGNLMLDK